MKPFKVPDHANVLQKCLFKFLLGVHAERI